MADSGRFTWNEGMSDSMQEVLGKIADKLSEQKFLTEGDIAKLLGFKSSVSNPFRYFCGDIDKYRLAMNDQIKECDEMIKETDLYSVKYLHREVILFIEQALDESSQK